MISCATAAPKATSFAGVPLVVLTPEDQKAVEQKIEQACGNPPRCPQDSVLERWALEFVKLRALVRAANP